MRLIASAFSLLSVAALASAYDPAKPVLARNPALSATTIVFEYGTDLWSIPRAGGQARRLTTGAGIESLPAFSPDGKWVAFTGDYDGNPDVYVVSATGGAPKRLTYHPSADQVRGWTPDGKSILFASEMGHLLSQNRLYTVPVTGGWPAALPLPRGLTGAFSPDAARIAYIPHDLWQPAWKRYNGGQTTPIWIARLSDSKVEKVPRANSNDRNPMWVGDKVYFISDRNGSATLFAYDTGSKRVSQIVAPETMAVKSAAAGPGGIVFERFGGLYLYDFAAKAEKKVPIDIEDDLTELRPQFRAVGNQIENADISPSGARAVFEARGDIFTVPVDKGDARNLTQTNGTAERTPVWTPDGKKIGYLSDASGNYQFYVADQMGGGKPDVYQLSDKPTYYHALNWSPDGKKLLYIDQSLNLYFLDLETKKYKIIDREPYYMFGDRMDPSWSPDGKWILYTKRGRNKLMAIHVYNMDTGKTNQLTDGLSDAASAAFDKSGRFIYFLASTDVAQAISTGGMSSFGSRVTSSVYVIVLRAADPSPLAPESDEEKGEVADGPPAPPDRAVKIDFDGIGQRILALPIPAGEYGGLRPITPRSFLLQRESNLLRFSLASRQLTPFASSVGGVAINPKGDKALLNIFGGFAIVGTAAPVQPGQGAIDVSEMQSFVDPRAEWRQMFLEVWRNERDFLYDPNTHGLDVDKVIKRYEPYLENLSSRNDFNYLMEDMLNEVTVGHTFSGGGDVPGSRRVPGGLLGADYKLENGRYRFARVFDGENWNPNLRAPLTQPGAQVKTGEYLLAVNGRDLTDKQNVYEMFENTSGKQVRIKVGATPDGAGAREIVVVPIGNESGLRYKAWVEDNRRKVDQLSGGKISYVHMPDTGGSGFSSFNRYFLAQIDKDAVLVDDRYNEGGALSDYVVQILSRQVLGNGHQRDSEDFAIPIFSNEGPKAMLINEMAGSGGDALPWFFRTGKVGPLIGKRTWGGLVAAATGVSLMGGGFATAPQVAIYGVHGEWGPENNGVGPDIEVDEDPALWRQGRDPQLETAVNYLLDQLKKNPPKKYIRPAYPNYHKNDGLGKTKGG